jgi:cellulose biosynthesis protein BcsQ
MSRERDILTAVDLMLADYEKDGAYNDYHDYVDEYGHTAIVKMMCQPTQYHNLDILPAFTTDNRFSRFVYSNKIDLDTAKSLLKTKVIDHLIDEYDVIFIDTSPSMEIYLDNALEAASGLLIPVAPRRLDWTSTTYYFEQLPQVLAELPSKGKNIDWYRVLLNNVEHEYNRDAKMVADIQNVMDAKNMFIKSIERSSAFEVAAQNFRTVLDMRQKEKLAPPLQLNNAKTCVNAVARELNSILKTQKGI